MGRESRSRAHFGIVRADGRPASAPPKMALGYSYGTLHGAFLSSLLGLIQREQRSEAPLVRALIPQHGIYIGENRNRIVQCFMKTDADWLLQIDTDIEFPPTLPETMLDLAGRERRILAASVPLAPPIPGCALNRNEVPGLWDYVPEDRITEEGIECDAVATAVVLIHREVFEAIADREGQCWFLQTGPGAVLPNVKDASSRAAWNGEGPIRDRQYVHIGEDVLFCMRAEDAGFRSYCAKVPGLRHHKVVPLSHDFATDTPAMPIQEVAR